MAPNLGMREQAVAATTTCDGCHKTIKGKMVMIVPSRLEVALGAPYKNYHLGCARRAGITEWE